MRGETRTTAQAQPIVIPPELSAFAEEEGLSYAETLELLQAHDSIVARRSARGTKRFSVEDWRELHKAVKRVFG